MPYGGRDGKDGALLRCSLVQRRDDYPSTPLESALTNKALRVDAANHTESVDFQRTKSYHTICADIV